MSAMKEGFVLEEVQQYDYALETRQPLVPVFAGMSADFATRLIAINNSAFVCPWVEGLRARGNTGLGYKIRGCRRSPPRCNVRKFACCNCKLMNRRPYSCMRSMALGKLGW